MVKIGVMESLEKGALISLPSLSDDDDDAATKIYDKFSIKLNYNSHSQLFSRKVRLSSSSSPSAAAAHLLSHHDIKCYYLQAIVTVV